MNYLFYNIDDGGLEAHVHGKKNGILKSTDYFNLIQCDTLEDVKLHLATTEYGSFLKNVPSPLNTNIIVEKATEMLVQTFSEFRFHASKSLAKFLDYITYDYMISNVVKLISSTVQKKRDILEVMYKLHPLGKFETIGALIAAQNIDEVYKLVLIDSPIGQFFTETDKQDFSEYSMEYIKNLLRKNYLESFYDYCRELGGTTEEVMCRILEFEADRTVLTITRNSFNIKELPKEEKRGLYPNFGQLLDIHEELSAAKSDDDIKKILHDGKLDPSVRMSSPSYKEFLDLFHRAEELSPDSSMEEKAISLERVLSEKEIELHKDSFNQQFHYGVFYSYLKLVEQEINNIMWISACITAKDKSRINEYIKIY